MQLRMAREVSSKESAIAIQSGVRGLNTRRMLLSMMKTSKQKHSVFRLTAEEAFATSMAKFKQEDLNSVTETLAQAKLATAPRGQTQSVCMAKARAGGTTRRTTRRPRKWIGNESCCCATRGAFPQSMQCSA